jgi:hypothetical protein
LQFGLPEETGLVNAVTTSTHKLNDIVMSTTKVRQKKLSGESKADVIEQLMCSTRRVLQYIDALGDPGLQNEKPATALFVHRVDEGKGRGVCVENLIGKACQLLLGPYHTPIPAYLGGGGTRCP